MLPRLKFLFFIISVTVTFGLISFVSSKDTMADHCFIPPPQFDIQIIKPERCEVVSGTKTIIVRTEPYITRINIKLWAEGFGLECEVIAVNLPPFKMETTQNEFRKSWDSSAEIDFHKYLLLAEDANQTGGGMPGILPISTSNGTTGELCGDPDPPPDDGDDGGSSGEGSESGSSESQSSSGVSESTSNQIAQTTEDSKEKDDKGKVQEAIVEEEVPITIDAFDPDLFLKGGNVEISDIKNIEDGDQTLLEFSGKAKPKTLVTLYIFSNAVIAVVKSDDLGNWSFTRGEEISPGKHTAFATIYDEGVTRRSEVKEFFVTQSGSRGSLILSGNNLDRFYPYAAILGGTIIMSILILYLYRIYSKRKPINI